MQGLFIKALRQAKTDAHPMLQNLMGGSLQTYRNCKSEACLECVGVAVEIFGALQGVAGFFGQLFGELSAISFEMIHQSSGISSSPEVVTAYFEMCYRFLIFCPEAIVSHPSLRSVLDLATACVVLKEKEPLRCLGFRV